MSEEVMAWGSAASVPHLQSTNSVQHAVKGDVKDDQGCDSPVLQAEPCKHTCRADEVHVTGTNKNMAEGHATVTHLDEGVQLLITTDGQLQMAGGDTLHLWVSTSRLVATQRASRERLCWVPSMDSMEPSRLDQPVGLANNESLRNRGVRI